MVEVIGVRFRTAGKIYFFNPKEFQVPVYVKNNALNCIEGDAILKSKKIGEE